MTIANEFDGLRAPKSGTPLSGSNPVIDSAVAGVSATAVSTTNKLVDAAGAPGYVDATVGAEAAVAANAIEIACTIKDAMGNAVTSATEVIIESLAVTADKGDIAAAGTPVGTLNKAFNPTTGPNIAHMTSTAAGLVSFRISNDQAEVTGVRITAEGCKPKVLKLTFT